MISSTDSKVVTTLHSVLYGNHRKVHLRSFHLNDKNTQTPNLKKPNDVVFTAVNRDDVNQRSVKTWSDSTCLDTRTRPFAPVKLNFFCFWDFQARFKLRTYRVPNLMQMSKSHYCLTRALVTVSLIALASTARTQLHKVGPKACIGAFWQPLYGPCMTLEHSHSQLE